MISIINWRNYKNLHKVLICQQNTWTIGSSRARGKRWKITCFSSKSSPRTGCAVVVQESSWKGGGWRLEVNLLVTVTLFSRNVRSAWLDRTLSKVHICFSFSPPVKHYDRFFQFLMMLCRVRNVWKQTYFIPHPLFAFGLLGCLC